jgi:hypothetical protein
MSMSVTGFTLAELLLAAAILAVVLVGLLQLFLGCILLNEMNRNLSAATTHAEYVLEGVWHVPFVSIASQINAGDWDFTGDSDFTAAGLTRLNGETIDTQISGSDPYNITVTVQWYDQRQRQRSLSLQTKVTNIVPLFTGS